MNKDQVKGKAKEAEGTVQRKWGEATNDPEDKAKGAAKEAKGKAKQAKGDFKEKVRSDK